MGKRVEADREEEEENLRERRERASELSRLMYFSFLEIAPTSFLSSSFEVTSHGPILFVS